jgi:predicted porin
LRTGCCFRAAGYSGAQAFVGIESPFGALTLGRQKVPLYDYFTYLDRLSYYSYSIVAQDAQYNNRADNSAKYVASVGPFSIDMLYSTGYDATIDNGGQVPGEFRVGNEASIGTQFAQGPFRAAVVYDLRRGTSIATQSDKEERVAAGASYELLQSLKAFVGYKWFRSSIPGAAIGRSDMYYGGLQYRVNAPLLLSAAAYWTDIKSAHQHPLDLGVNADYALSKRTQVYTEVSYVKNSNGSNLGVAGYNTNIVAGNNQLGVAIGLLHLF